MQTNETLVPTLSSVSIPNESTVSNDVPKDSSASITFINCQEQKPLALDHELQQPISILTSPYDWRYWSYYCDITQREIRLANHVRKLLESLRIVPSVADLLPTNTRPTLIDIGCGTMEFTTALKIPHTLGMDVTDFRIMKNTLFIHAKLEDIVNGSVSLPHEYRIPDIVIFKQSFHLIQNNHAAIQTLFPRSYIVILQSTFRPWNRQPYTGNGESPQANQYILEQNGRQVQRFRTEFHYLLHKDRIERLLIGGFQSDIRKLALKDRLHEYDQVCSNNIHTLENSQEIIFYDIMDILVASPVRSSSSPSTNAPTDGEEFSKVPHLPQFSDE